MLRAATALKVRMIVAVLLTYVCVITGRPSADGSSNIHSMADVVSHEVAPWPIFRDTAIYCIALASLAVVLIISLVGPNLASPPQDPSLTGKDIRYASGEEFIQLQPSGCWKVPVPAHQLEPHR